MLIFTYCVCNSFFFFFFKFLFFFFFWLCWVFAAVKAFLCSEQGVLSSYGASRGDGLLLQSMGSWELRLQQQQFSDSRGSTAVVLGPVFQWHVGSPGPGIKLASPALAHHRATREALQQLFMPKYRRWPASQVALVAKNLPANAGDVRHLGLIPGLGNKCKHLC